jgi:hypothetical protein
MFNTFMNLTFIKLGYLKCNTKANASQYQGAIPLYRKSANTC